MGAHVAEDQGAGHNAPDGELATLRCEAEPLVAHLQHLIKTANKAGASDHKQVPPSEPEPQGKCGGTDVHVAERACSGEVVVGQQLL